MKSALPIRLLCMGLFLLLLVPLGALAQDTATGGVATDFAEPLAPTAPWHQHITEAAQANGLDVHLLHALVKVESNFNPSAVSRFGAVGLMQIMPATGAAVSGLRGTRQSLTQQLRDPATNVHAGARYLRSLMDTFSNRLDLVLAAYNAGTGNVRKAGNRVPRNGETPKFVKKVTALYVSLKAAAYAAEASTLAATEPTAPALSQPASEPQ
jgi:soluble lytic murein transglycosylase-like protein